MAYTRRTQDEWVIYGNYGYGWEELTTESSYSEAKSQLRCYNENEPNIPHRLRIKRVKK